MQLEKRVRSLVECVVVLAGLALPATAQGVPNDNCAGAWPLGLGQTPVTNEGASNSAGSVSCGTIGADVWYSIVPPSSGLLTISTVVDAGASAVGDAGSTFPIDTLIAVYSGACGALVPLACNDDFGFSLQSKVQLPVTEGELLLVRVGGFLGEIGNFVLTVSFDDPSLTPNDDCSGALLVTTPTISGSTLTAITDDDAGACTFAGRNIWYAFAAPASGQLTASLLHNGGSADFDTALAVYSGSCDALQPVACNDDFSATQFESEVSFAVTAGTLYFISVGGFFGDSGHFTLALDFEPGAAGPFTNPANGHVFMLGPPGMTWSQARDYATSIGGHLATLGGFLEFIYVFGQFSAVDSPCWIGLTDEDSEGSFTWVTGEPSGYANWEPGQPDNNCSGGAENRVAMLPFSGTWVDTNETGCALGLLPGLIEFDVAVPLATSTSVGQSCATGTLPVLLGNLPVLGSEITLTVLDPGMVSAGAILASAIPQATTTYGRCTIEIELATRFVVAAVVTDSFGFSAVSVTVPSVPALVGAEFALQAFLVRASDRSSAITNGLHVVLGY